MLILAVRRPGIATADEEKAKTVEQLETLRADIDRYTKQFEMIETSREVTWEDLEVLKLAIEAQRDYITALETDLVPNDVQSRLAEFQEKYDTAAGKLLRDASEVAEKKATQLSREGQPEAAIAAMTEAIDLQMRINREFSRGRYADRARLNDLELAKGKLEVAPLVQQLRNLRQDADFAYAQDDFATAAQKRSEALELARRISSDYGNTRSVRSDDLVALERQVKETEAAVRQRQIAEREEAAAKMAKDGQVENAVKEIEAAQELFRALQRDYPNSSWSSSERGQQLETTRQTILSQKLGRRAEELDAELAQSLRQRRANAARDQIAELWGVIDELNTHYKLSAHRDEERLVRIRYLNLVRDQLDQVTELAWVDLAPAPGEDSVRLARHETSQGLYRLVMGSNPSSRVREDAPVESVTWKEADEFCTRLGWILAHEVSLPSEAVYRSALGPVDPTLLADGTVHAANSSREVGAIGRTPANPQGFSDLLGNVEEWLSDANPQNGREALVIGGTARDDLTALERVPTRFVAKDSRDRFRGFRWMLRVDASE